MTHEAPGLSRVGRGSGYRRGSKSISGLEPARRLRAGRRRGRRRSVIEAPVAEQDDAHRRLMGVVLASVLRAEYFGERRGIATGDR